MLIKNKLTQNQINSLPTAIANFLSETKTSYNPSSVIHATLGNIRAGIHYSAQHDTWISGDIDCYCLCKDEIDADGARVYTAYQLWISPEARGLNAVHSLVRFLKFYAQKQGYKRLYVLSSRIDKIKAYSRGLGQDFKIKTVTFTKEF